MHSVNSYMAIRMCTERPYRNSIDYCAFLFMILVSLLLIISRCRTRRGTLSCQTSRRSLSVGRVDSKVNVLFRRRPDIEGRNGNKLRSNTDVTLSDQDTSMVDGLGQTLLVNLGLKAAFQQLLGGQLKDRIQLELIIGQ